MKTDGQPPSIFVMLVVKMNEGVNLREVEQHEDETEAGCSAYRDRPSQLTNPFFEIWKRILPLNEGFFKSPKEGRRVDQGAKLRPIGFPDAASLQSTSLMDRSGREFRRRRDGRPPEPTCRQ